MSVLAAVTVGVMGSSQDEHLDLTEPLGELLGRLEVNVLTGAGRGVMTSVSRAFLRSRRGRGITIGVVPCTNEHDRHIPRAGSPNRYIELPIYTHLPLSGLAGSDDLSRNHINILSSDVVIALPGSDGTRNEVELAMKYQKPVALFAADVQAVASYAAEVRRLHDIVAVEEFLLPQIAAAEHSRRRAE